MWLLTLHGYGFYINWMSEVRWCMKIGGGLVLCITLDKSLERAFGDRGACSLHNSAIGCLVPWILPFSLFPRVHTWLRQCEHEQGDWGGGVEFEKYGTNMLSGTISWFAGAALWVTSLEYVRRHYFEACLPHWSRFTFFVMAFHEHRLSWCPLSAYGVHLTILWLLAEGS